MGAKFKLEHANIVAYISARSSVGAPRVRKGDLSSFLRALAENASRYLVPEEGEASWPNDIAKRADHCYKDLLAITGGMSDEETVLGSQVESLVRPLRSDFSRYSLFALAVGTGERLKRASYELARLPMSGILLVLIPEQGITERNFEILDPLPTFSLALHAADKWPGFLIWTAKGASTFAPLGEEGDVIRELKKAARPRQKRGSPGLWHFDSLAWDAALRKQEQPRASSYRRLLHLSDLHFGTDDATENQSILDAQLRTIVQTVDRVVITGDLFDTPDKGYAVQFNTFRQQIAFLSGGKEPIAITGNHDQRMKGIWGKDYEQVAKIGPSRIEVDDDCRMIFICFNSSEKGVLARGKISASQFRRLGGEYANLLASRPELSTYLPIVLVHHHPFSFIAEPEGWLELALDKIRVSLEPTLVLKNAVELHQWCVDWKIKTILHGHKHKARYVERNVSHGKDQMLLTAIGCGSSLGAEGSPVSYNLIEWESEKQKWVASFLESVNGGAFREIAVSVSP